MKKTLGLILASMLVGGQAMAEIYCGDASPCSYFMTSTIGTTFAPTLTAMAISGELKNEIALVQDSAAVALEAGIVSSELKSVVDKIRFEYAREFNGASDMEIIEYVFAQ